MTPETLAHLSGLTPALAEAFLRHCQGMSQAEIAVDLGLSAVAVRKRLSRAGIRIRQKVWSHEVDAMLDRLEEAVKSRGCEAEEPFSEIVETKGSNMSQ